MTRDPNDPGGNLIRGIARIRFQKLTKQERQRIVSGSSKEIREMVAPELIPWKDTTHEFIRELRRLAEEYPIPRLKARGS